jgi:hypothetical protein
MRKIADQHFGHGASLALLRQSVEGHPASRCRKIEVLRSALARSRMERAKGIERALQKFDELLHRQAGLSDDRAHSAWFQISPA